MELAIWLFALIVSIVFLSKSADLFSDFSERIGKSMGMSQFITGVVIIAIGTSLPEFGTSLLSALKGEGGMAAGNVYGTVIVNILLGLGIAAAFNKKEIVFNMKIFNVDVPILVGGIFLSYFIFADLVLTRGEATILILAFMIYIRHVKSNHDATSLSKNKRPPLKIKDALGSLASLAVLIIASHYTVESAIKVAGLLGVGNSEIASSIIATGTSLPEITVAYMAARKQKFELLVGDIMGSNIFDIFVIPGTFGLISVTHVTPELITLTIPFCIASAILYWLVSSDAKISKPEGGFMILLYVVYIGKLFSFF